MRYEVVVAGLGGMGSAVLAHAARRTPRALGIERFALNHSLGASAGRSRIVRKAYFEAPAYVPLLERAYALWRELERDARTSLLDLMGVLLLGAPDAQAIAGASESAARFGVVVETLDRDALRERYPHLRTEPNEVGVFEPDAGIVVPERAVDAHLRVALARGAEVRDGVALAGWEPAHGAVHVRLSDGTTLETERLALCAGPWLVDAARDAGVPLRVQRNVQVWFASGSAYARDRLPAFFLDRRGAPCALYGVPDLGAGLKAALHGFGEETAPDALVRDVSEADVAAVRARLDTLLPGAAGAVRATKACMYALTPDAHFAIGLHPASPRTVFAGGFSGHGFKFAPVVGELVTELLFDGGTHLDIGFLSPARFAQAQAAATSNGRA